MTKFTRLAPGYYRADSGHEITRVTYPNDGTYWIVTETDGTAWDPFYTLADAKSALTR